MPTVDELLGPDTAAPKPSVSSLLGGGQTPLTALERFGHGMMDPIYGAAQIGARMGPEEGGAAFGQAGPSPSEMDKIARDREAAYQSGRKIGGDTGVDWARIAGNVLSPVDLAISAALGPMAPETLAGKIGVSALGGAAGGILSQTEGEDFWSEKGKQFLEGMAGGAAIGGAGAAIGTAIAPHMSSDAAKLAEAGVQMTPGQMAGGLARRTEEALLKNFPILSYFVRGAEKRSVESFNRATLNQALEPVGGALPKDVKIGYEAVDHAAGEIGRAYESALSGASLAQDADFANSMAALRQVGNTMVPERREQFLAILDDKLLRRFDEAGTMNGTALKQAESSLRKEAMKYRRSTDADQQGVGIALEQARNVLRANVLRQNPEAAPQIRNADAAYAMLVRIEDAAGRRLRSDGVFSPTDLMAAVKQDSPLISGRRRAFAHGDALFQGWSRTAQRVLPSEVAESGTVERQQMMEAAKAIVGTMGGETAGHAFGTSVPLEVLLGGGIGLSPFYTPVGQRVAQRYMTPGATRESARGVLEKLGLVAAPGGGQAAGR